MSENIPPRRPMTAEELRRLGHDARESDSVTFALMDMVSTHRGDVDKEITIQKARVDTVDARIGTVDEKVKLQNVALFGELRYPGDNGVIGQLLTQSARNSKLLVAVLTVLTSGLVALMGQLIYTVLTHQPSK